MFESLTEQLSQTLRSLSGKARLSEDNIQDSLRDVRKALLEADVALPVVKDFIERVKLRALGQEVSRSLSPGQAFLKIVQAELQMLMGDENSAVVEVAREKIRDGGQRRRLSSCRYQTVGNACC